MNFTRDHQISHQKRPTIPLVITYPFQLRRPLQSHCSLASIRKKRMKNPGNDYASSLPTVTTSPTNVFSTIVIICRACWSSVVVAFDTMPAQCIDRGTLSMNKSREVNFVIIDKYAGLSKISVRSSYIERTRNNRFAWTLKRTSRDEM